MQSAVRSTTVPSATVPLATLGTDTHPALALSVAATQTASRTVFASTTGVRWLALSQGLVAQMQSATPPYTDQNASVSQATKETLTHCAQVFSAPPMTHVPPHTLVMARPV